MLKYSTYSQRDRVEGGIECPHFSAVAIVAKPKAPICRLSRVNLQATQYYRYE